MKACPFCKFELIEEHGLSDEPVLYCHPSGHDCLWVSTIMSQEQWEAIADAKLGRMVRAMPVGMFITPGLGQYGEPPWICCYGGEEEDQPSGHGDTPEEALERAGVKP